ncbi:hypothetical protein [Candidatus Bealeia paramacronuclearis]|uniref:hypothetical protein n=1 Tax=Candidatus Bealeia paramacronuclearis TaxID=1921001 RepID=UPI0030CDCDB9
MSSYTGHLDKKRNQTWRISRRSWKTTALREYNRKILEMEAQQNKWRDEQEENTGTIWRKRPTGDEWPRECPMAVVQSVQNLAQMPGLDTLPAIATKQEHSQYVRDRKNFGHVLSELKSIRSSWNDFRELSKMISLILRLLTGLEKWRTRPAI